jgi:antitoxin VapB
VQAQGGAKNGKRYNRNLQFNINSALPLHGGCMATAKAFKSGNRQAIRLPREFHIRPREVEIKRRGDEIVLREKFRGLERAFYLIAELEIDEGLNNRKKDKPQKRKGL